MTKSSSASMKLDDAFTPTHAAFTECNKTIEFFMDDESVRVSVSENDEHIMSMRIPLYASVAIAQMFTGTLNGKRILK